MINFKNTQKSFKAAFYSLLIFAVVFVSALVNFISTTGKLDGWLELDDAIEIANDEHKPIIVNFYSRFNQLSKNINNQIFANKSIKQFFNENFVLAGVNVSKKDVKENLDSVYKISAIPAYLFLDNSGKELFRFEGSEAMNILNNFSSKSAQSNLLDNIKFILSWKSYNDAKEILNIEQEKFMLVAVVNEPNNSRKMMYIFDGPKTKSFIREKFIPVYLNASNNNDQDIIINIKNDIIKDNFPDNGKDDSFKISIGDVINDYILILDNNMNYISHFNPQTNLYDDEVMKNKMELIITKAKKEIE